MSNGVRVELIQYSEHDTKFLITMFLNDEDSTWVEFDKDQFDNLLEIFKEQRSKYETRHE